MKRRWQPPTRGCPPSAESRGVGCQKRGMHIAFRTSGHKCTCSDCGGKFDYKGKGKSVRCPHCGHRLQVTDTMKRKCRETSYFSTLEAIDGLQVQRVFLLNVCYRKGEPMRTTCWECAVCGLVGTERLPSLQGRGR